MHNALADNTPCPGPDVICRENVCLAGECRQVPAPDGQPCTDEDMCTIADRCEAGACAGTRPQDDPRVVASAHTYGSNRQARATALADGRILVADSWPLKIEVLEPDADGVPRSVGRTAFPDYNRSGWLYQLGEEQRLVTLASEVSSLKRRLRLLLLEIEPDGRVREVASRYVGPGDGGWTCKSVGGMAGSFFYFHDQYLVRIIEISDSGIEQHEPIQQSASSLGIVVDPQTGRLFVSTIREGMYVFDLSDPRLPQPLDQLMPGVNLIPQAVNHEVLLATERGYPPPYHMHAIDPRSLEIITSIEQENKEDAAVFTDAGLVVSRWRYGGEEDMELWDFSNPSQPELIGAEHRTKRVISDSGGCRIAGAGGDWLFMEGEEGIEMRRLRPDATLVFEPVTGPGHGRMRYLVGQGPVFHAVNWNAATRIDAGQMDHPRIVAGSTFADNVGFMSLGANGAPPTLFLGIGMTTYPAPWVDVSDPSHPVPRGHVLFGDGNCRLLESDGRLLVALSYASEEEPPVLELYELERFTPAEHHEPAPCGTIEIPVAQTSCRGGALYSRIALAPDRVLLSMFRYDTQENVFVMVDVSTHTHPGIVWTQTHPVPVIDLQIAAGRVVTLEEDQQSLDVTLRSFDQVQDGLEDRGGLCLDESSWVYDQILFTDGNTVILKDAFLTNEPVLEYYNIRTSPPRLEGVLPVPDNPRSVATFADHLIVLSDDTFEVLTPPCPPAVR